MPKPGRRRGVAAFGAVAALALVLSLELAVGRSKGIVNGRYGLLGVIVGWLLVAFLLGRLVEAVHRHAATITIVIALVVQGFGLAFGPQLSDDLYRYVWDGRVAAAGIDPYRFAPADPALIALRTPDLWPTGEQCHTLRADLPAVARADPLAGLNGDLCTKINRPTVRTIYPPTAEAAFRVSRLLTPHGWPVELQVEVPAALVSLAVTLLLVFALRRFGRSPARALAYAAGPLAGLEAAMDGHVDVLAALLGLAGLLLVSTRRETRHAAAASLLVTSAVLTKLYPAALALVFVAAYRRRPRTLFVVTLVGLATVVVLYLPHVRSVGVEVLGYLPGYLRENGYGSGMRYLLIGSLLPTGLAPTAAAVSLLLIVVATVVRTVNDASTACRAAADCVGWAMLVLTPGNAWYCSLITVLCLCAARPRWLPIAAASYVVYFVALLGGDQDWATAAYGGAACLVIAAIIRGRLQAGSTVPLEGRLSGPLVARRTAP